MTANNANAWNTVGGQCFTSANGLNGSTCTLISFPFTTPAIGILNWHIGAHSQTGVVQQSAGTVFVYGWRMILQGKTTVLEGNLSLRDGKISCSALTTWNGVSGGLLTSSGDVLYNGSTSLITSLSTLNDFRTSGTFAATTSFGTFYTMSYLTGPRAFVTVKGTGATPSMVTCFFEWSTGSFPSFTQTAASANAQQSSLSTSILATAGTQQITLQQNGVTGNLQVKVVSAITVSWNITLL